MGIYQRIVFDRKIFIWLALQSIETSQKFTSAVAIMRMFLIFFLKYFFLNMWSFFRFA